MIQGESELTFTLGSQVLAVVAKDAQATEFLRSLWPKEYAAVEKMLFSNDQLRAAQQLQESEVLVPVNFTTIALYAMADRGGGIQQEEAIREFGASAVHYLESMVQADILVQKGQSFNAKNWPLVTQSDRLASAKSILELYQHANLGSVEPWPVHVRYAAVDKDGLEALRLASLEYIEKVDRVLNASNGVGSTPVALSLCITQANVSAKGVQS